MTAIRTEATAARRVRPMVPLSLGYFMVILDATVVNVALPALGRGLHTGVSGLQWIVDAYTLVLAAFLLAGGSLADRLGGRRVLQAGLVLFSGASAACGLAAIPRSAGRDNHGSRAGTALGGAHGDAARSRHRSVAACE